MSRSARRLSSSVTTDRFAWQGLPPAGPLAIVPLLPPMAAPVAPEPIVTPPIRERPVEPPPVPAPVIDPVAIAEQQAYARGVIDGQQAAETDTTARLDAMAADLATAIRDLAAVRGDLMRRAERDLVRLALAMAERVLHREVTQDRDRLVALARLAIERLGENVAVRLHLNPADLEAIRTAGALDVGQTVEVTADAAIARGGCIVTSAFGTIEVGIEAQVREMARELLGDDVDTGEEERDRVVIGS